MAGRGCPDPTDRKRLARALARTYRGEVDGWTRVQEYNRVIKYTGRHPNKGSAAVATALELPRGRIRPWMDKGAKPDPVHGVQTAAERGWLDLIWEGATLRALTVAVAWLFSGGSVDERFVPAVAVERATRWLAEDMLSALDVGHRERHADSDSRATELVPGADGAVLGRVLVALGAPQGVKREGSVQDLPQWLSAAPVDLRRVFARTYVFNRGTDNPARENRPVILKEDRGPHYRQALRALFESLVDASAVAGNSKTLALTPAAAAVLRQPPRL